MAMRVTETPTGGSRIAMAVLAAVLAGIGATLVATVVWPLVTNEQTCANDPTDLCGLALALALLTVGFWLVLAWAAYGFRLGWLFVLAVVVGQLVAVQAAVQWVSVAPLALLVVIVPLAAWVSSPGRLLPARTGNQEAAEEDSVPSRRLGVVLGACLVLLVQLGVWLWRLLV